MIQFLLNFLEANKETMLNMAAICNLTLIYTSYDENCAHLVRSLAQIGCDRALIGNGNGTDWSPIRSVIIRVINKIGRPRSGSPICLITSMMTDRIGRHEVLLPINHNFNKIFDIIRYFLNQNTRNSKFCCFPYQVKLRYMS